MIPEVVNIGGFVISTIEAFSSILAVFLCGFFSFFVIKKSLKWLKVTNYGRLKYEKMPEIYNDDGTRHWESEYDRIDRRNAVRYRIRKLRGE